MPVELVDIVLLLAAAQGLFLAILILHRHRTVYANRFLGALILGYSLVLLHLFLDEIEFSFNHPILPFIALGLVFIVAPFHYLYSQYLMENRHRFFRRDGWHLLPLGLYYVIGSLVFIIFKSKMIHIARSDHENKIHAFYLSFNWIVILYSAFYIIFTLKLLSDYRKRIRDMFSSIEKIRLDWLKNITVMMASALSVFMIENILYLAGIDLSNQFTLSSTLIAVYIYALGYQGLFKSEIFHHPQYEKPIQEMVKMHVSTESKKYGKSGLSSEKARRIEKELVHLMDYEKPFLNSDLTLNQLADLLKVTPHNLSEVINTRLQQNFFDFINTYRVEQVKADLKNPDKIHLKVLAIAFDAGFNSKTAFNTIFKKITGKTPSQYRRAHL
ncbi:helix-turn-helix transcriptional regulator [bacterium]|nr:helix-turn-helix transcriptional regulator [bacterium]